MLHFDQGHTEVLVDIDFNTHCMPVPRLSQWKTLYGVSESRPMTYLHKGTILLTSVLLTVHSHSCPFTFLDLGRLNELEMLRAEFQ